MFHFPRVTAGSSPLSRGIRSSCSATASSSRIIPALAGNTLTGPVRAFNNKDHPRSRGEYGHHPHEGQDRKGSSPLSRGILGELLTAGRPGRIIPALAGNTNIVGPDTGRGGDHPRSRGEYFSLRPVRRCRRGSSPLSRGIHAARDYDTEHGRIIPALAGNTTSPAGRATHRPDHPRSRGEYRFRILASDSRRGSSPLSRGIRSSRDRRSPW